MKRRIRNILKYRRPSLVSAACLMICALIVCKGCFADGRHEEQSAAAPDIQPKQDQAAEDDITAPKKRQCPWTGTQSFDK